MTDNKTPYRLVLAIFVFLAIPLIPAHATPEGAAIYSDTIANIDQAKEEGQQGRALSDMAMMAAVQCQELGSHKEAIELFEKAIKLDATNAEAFRRYGDYMIMYRGIASLDLYLKAKAIIDKDPDAFDDEMKKNLKRSLQILYRDNQWGVPLMVNRGVAIFFTPYIEYSEMGERQLYLDMADVGHNATLTEGEIADQDGLAWFEPLLKEQQDGVSWFKDASEDNEEGIRYFEGRLPEIKDGINYFEGQIPEMEEGIRYFSELIVTTQKGFDDWYTYITNLYWTNYGYIPDCHEDLGDGVTICGRRESVENDIKSYRNRIKTIWGDIGATEEKVALAEQELETTLKQIEQAEADKETNDEKADLAAKDAADTQARIDQINAELAKIQKVREEIQKKKTRKPRQVEYGADVKVVFPAMNLPDVWLYAKRIDVRDAGLYITETFDLHDVSRTFTEFGASVGKRHLLGYNWDLNWWAGIRSLKSASMDDTLDEDLYTEDLFAYNIKPKLTYSMPQKTLSLNSEFEFGDIGKTDEITGDTLYPDDHMNSQLISLRLSLYPKDEAIRFGQNKSIHFEAGVRRVERDYRGDIVETQVEEDLQPFALVEPLGLLRGRMDCPVKYALHQMSYSTGFEEGTYKVHEVTVTPTWVPIYRLYDRAFFYGFEELRLGFPLKYSTGDGDNDFYGGGVKFETRMVTRYNFVLRPTVELEVRDYHETDDVEWGGRVKLVVSM